MVAKKIDLGTLTFKKIKTVNDLRVWLNALPELGVDVRKTPITMFSDEEGNQINGILCLQLFEDGLTIVPWERNGE